MRLLVVDWDYFFPVKEHPDPDWMLYDWGHSETWPAGLLNMLWTMRAAEFARANLERPGIDQAWQTFSARFRISKKARLYIADSNAMVFDPQVRRGIKEVWLFDAHHDCGYSQNPVADLLKAQTIDCGNWMLGYWIKRAELHMRYPAWRAGHRDTSGEVAIPIDRTIDPGGLVKPVFNRVFICRSSAWVPSWGDGDFFQFLKTWPGEAISLDPNLHPREWQDSQVDEHIEAWKGVKKATYQKETPG